MKIYRIRENSNWNRGPFDFAAKKHKWPSFGIVAESPEQFFEFLRQHGLTQDSNEYLSNPAFYEIQAREYSGRLPAGSKVQR